MTDSPTPTRDLGNIECEQALIGALLLENDLYQRIGGTLSEEHFHDPLHARLFKVIGTRIAAGDVVNLRSIKSYINANETVGEISVREYLARLVAEVPSLLEFSTYARTIVSDSIRRRLVAIARDAEAAVLQGDPEEPVERLLEKIEVEFAGLRKKHHVNAPDFNPSGAVSRAMEMIGDAHLGKRVGWPWCLPEIERVMDGPLQPGNLYGLLGASGDGKTSIVLQTLRFLAGQGVPFLFLSGEQEPEQCVLQMHAQKLGITLADMLKKDGLSQEEADRIFEDAQAIAKLPWAIEKWTDCRVSQLGMKIRGFVKRYGRGVIAIDHAKKIQPDNPKDILPQQVSQVFGDVKDLMGSTGCAGILLMQRNSEFLKRRNMWPIRGDCYGGEGTLQNLDGCLTLYRADRWLKESLVHVERETEREKIEQRIIKEAGKAWFGNLKNRFGEENRRNQVGFTARFTRFVSFEQQRAEREPELIPV